MGLFGKKKKAQAETDQVLDEVREEKPAKKAKEKKRKRSERLASVVKETVTDQVMVDVRANKMFDFILNGELWHTCLLLDTADIGGLSKKECHDEAKGSFVEYISSGRVKIIATPALLDMDSLIIIPDMDTLKAMREFTMLNHVYYRLVFVSDDGAVMVTQMNDDDPEISISLDTAQDVLYEARPGDEAAYIISVIADGGVGWAREMMPAEDVDYDSEYDGVNDETMLMSVVDEDEPIELDETADETTDETVEANPAPAADPLADVMDAVSDSVNAQNTNVAAEQAPVPQQAAQPAPQQAPVERLQAAPTQARATAAAHVQQQAPQRNMTRDELEREITNTFMSNNLGLEVSTEHFDARFGSVTRFIGFPETPINAASNGFLADQLAHLRRLANEKLRAEHNMNIEKMRNEYVKLLEEGVNKIINELAYSETGDTKWCAGFRKIIEERDSAKSMANGQADEMKRMLDAQFEAAVEAYAQRAANQARTEYRERNMAEHTHQMLTVAEKYAADILMNYEDALDSFEKERRVAAAQQFELLDNTLVSIMAERLNEIQASERKMFDAYATQMRDFIDKNRKDDIAYSQALSESLAREDKVMKLTAERDAEVEHLRKQATADIKRLEAELVRAEETRERMLAEREQAHKVTIERMTAEHADLEKRANALLEKVDEARREGEASAEGRVKSLQMQLDESNARVEDMHVHQKHVSWVVITLFIVVAVCAGCIGLLFGINHGAALVNAVGSVIM